MLSAMVHRLRGAVSLREMTEKKPICIHFNDVISESIKLLEPDTKDLNVDIEFHPEKNVQPVKADFVEMQQVVVNLIRNACEATAASDGSKTVYVRSENAGADVVTTVEDQGVGIAQSEIPQLFDAFYSTKSRGMGMGLAISRTIVENHGGSISARSADSTIFTVKVPAIEVQNVVL